MSEFEMDQETDMSSESSDIAEETPIEDLDGPDLQDAAEQEQIDPKDLEPGMELLGKQTETIAGSDLGSAEPGENIGEPSGTEVKNEVQQPLVPEEMADEESNITESSNTAVDSTKKEPAENGHEDVEDTPDSEENADEHTELIKLDDALAGASAAEKSIYEKLPLERSLVDGHESLTRTDIDYFTLDENGECNLDRMQEGKAPLVDGKQIQLHHIGQSWDSPFAEMTMEEHRCNGNDTILHDKTIPSGIDRNEATQERQNYWRTRAQEIIAKEFT